MAASKLYKYRHGLSPTLGEVFKVSKTIPYGLRMRNELYATNAETISFLSEKYTFKSNMTMTDY